MGPIGGLHIWRSTALAGRAKRRWRYTAARLERWGRWLKSRRPRVGIERIDAESDHALHRELLALSSEDDRVRDAFARCADFGDYLVREGLWRQNPLRWMKGPKVTPYSRLPKRIDQAHMEAMWRAGGERAAASTARILWVTVLAMLYGTGLRRGELERLDLEAFDRTEGDTADRWTQDRPRALCTGVGYGTTLLGGLSAAAAQRARADRRDSASSVAREPHAASDSPRSASATAFTPSARRAGVPIHSVHQFRHSCASDLLEAGVHLAEVQRILGHSGHCHHRALRAHRRSGAPRGDGTAPASTICLQPRRPEPHEQHSIR